MVVRHLVAFVLLAAVAAPAPPAMAQAPCGEPVPVPGVRDPGAVSLFMSGYPSPTGGLRVSRVSYLNYHDIVQRPRTVALAAYQREHARVTAPRYAERMLGIQFVSASYFDLLGVPIQAGRAFTAGDDAPGTAPLVAVLGDGLWASIFERDPRAVGQAVMVNGTSVTIVGVAAPAFTGLEQASDETLWLPGVALPLVSDRPGLRADDRASGGYYQFVARLAAGATWPQAREELAALTAWLASRYPAENEKFAVAAFHDYGPIGCLQRP